MAAPTPQQTPVLIVGSGSAGLCAAVWLARLGVPYTMLERRDGPLRIGQADGVQCRTVEIFESFGLSAALLEEAYHVLEVAFWTADAGDDEAAAPEKGASGGIRRTRFAADTEPGLSHLPHVILNQARLNALLIEDIERHGAGAGPSIEYGCEVTDVRIDGDVDDPEGYPVCVTSRKDGETKVYRAKYVLVG